MVEENRGKIVFYEMDPEVEEITPDTRYITVRPIKCLEPRHYNPEERAVGFVAGNEKIVDQIMERLLKIKVF